MSADQMAV
nr:unnamed protein product [Callosobruchus analis]